MIPGKGYPQSRVDIETLERLSEFGGKKVTIEMIRLFIAYTPNRLKECCDGFYAKNARAVEVAAHSLRSTCGQMGVFGMQKLAEEIEGAAETKSLDGLEPLVTRLVKEFDAVKLELEVKKMELEAGG
ncbi:MAG: hypothetical protein A2902_02435 [Elusimicrobia bacterium RIFCSPLOWO2_01_FULL_64_13]|nr:MAG: hypothetical protein A2636_04045 [Elusimicrobia bacterium RIFCSPHIGHO2_01_FULL_64_10]OGR94399.1 MAG: hypothetical protein A2902_02435 [Elusimicrobia bacterium RIFCSPLOWO2_01_FULL_64_13]